MGVYLNLSAAQKALHIQLMHDHMALYMRPCILIYTGEMVPCENCNPDTIGQMPGNFWSDGTALGPLDNCLMCGGTHYIAQEVQETVEMVIDWSPKELRQFGGNVTKPNSTVKARGKYEIWPKILRANKFLIGGPANSIDRFVFVRASEPVDENSFYAEQYFSVYLNRA